MKIDNKLILENSKNLHVLYVEDDEGLRGATSQLFLNFFDTVDTAIDGQDGLEKYQAYLDKTNVPYDIVISDINMPHMDGIEMYKKIKAINYEQVIIFITAFNEISYLHSAIKLGVNAFLTKPIDVDQLKDVLYKTTQVVADRKLVQKHYQQIEEANILNINLQDASEFTSSKDILNDLEINKELISNLWANKKIVYDRLENHSIDVEFFRSHYGIKVIEYFLSVVKGDSEVGNCPVVFVMLDFFKYKNLPLEDIFMICVQFKNTMTDYVFSKYSFNYKLFDDISYILDKNFEGVIINYLKMKGCDKQKTLEVAPIKVKEEEIVEEINYAEYVLEHDVYELHDLEQEIDSLAISVTMSSSSTVEDNTQLGNNIRRYGEILNNYPLFTELGQYIIKLGVNFSDNTQLLYDDKQRMSNITALVEGFVNDLIVWRKEIFENNIEDVHFLDSSFFSNVDTIIMFIEYDESAEVSNDGDMEFF